MKFTKQEDRKIIEGVKKNLTWKEIGSQLNRSAGSVRNRYDRMREKDPSLEMKVTFQEGESEPKYSVDKKDNVKWEYRHGEINITLDELDEIFYEYSKHGLNMSQVQVQNKHGFTAIQWQSLKRTFDLVKDSDVFSEIRLARYSGKEKTQMIADKIAEKYSDRNMRHVVAYEDDKQRRRAYKKAIQKSANLDYQRQKFEAEILEYIPKAKPVTVRKTQKPKGGHIVAHTCDWHIGAHVLAEPGLPYFDVEVIRKRLKKSAERTNQEDAEKVTVVINGDIIESFTGLNHINTWKNIDSQYGYGVQATIKAHEIMVEYLSHINNVHEVIITAGNHDRVTSSNKEDVDGETIQWLHYMLQSQVPYNVVHGDIVSREIDGIGYVFTHGHTGNAKKAIKNPSDIIAHYGNSKLYTLVVQGHLHSRSVSDKLKSRAIVAPSIFTGNTYSKDLGFGAVPGFLIMKKECEFELEGETLYLPKVEDLPLT